MSDRQLAHQIQQGILLIDAPSYLDTFFKKDLIRLAETFAQEKLSGILLDLSAVELINSHGVAGLLHLINEAKNQKMKLSVCNLNAALVQRILRISGLEEVISQYTYDNRALALKALKK